MDDSFARLSGESGPSAQKRERILRAALELFARQTFDGTRVPEIAARAGVAAGTIYRYFPSKEALVNDLYRRWKGSLAERLLGAAPFTDLRAEFDHYWSGLADFALANRDAWSFLEDQHHAHYLNEDSLRLKARIDREVGDFVTRGQAAGLFRPGSPEALAAMVLGAFDGILGVEDPSIDVKQLGEAAWDLLTGGGEGTTSHERR